MSNKNKNEKFQYKHIKILLLVIGILLMVIGPIIVTTSTSLNGDIEITPFTITEQECYDYGHFNTSRVSLRGTIIQSRSHKPAAGTVRPLVFCFHGMFGSWHDMLGIATILARMGFVAVTCSAPGSGDSLGQYNLGLELQGMGLTLVDWVWGKANSTYNLQVNGSQMGATGHSYGGITTTFLGINSPNITASVSFWTWSTALNAITNIIGVPGTFEALSGSNLWRIMQISGFGYAINPPYNDLETNLGMRDPIDDANFSQLNLNENKPKNWLLITGAADEVTKEQQQIDIMANASWNKTGNFDVFRKSINDSVQATRVWNNSAWTTIANFSSGTQREVFIPTGYDHGDIISSTVTLKKMVRWFGNAWNVDVETGLAELQIYEVPVFGEPYTTTYSFLQDPGIGSAIFLVGLVLTFLPIASLLIKRRKSDEEYYEIQDTVPENLGKMEKKDVVKSLGMYSGVVIGISFLPAIVILGLNLNSLMFGVPYLIADVYTVINLTFTLFLIPAIIGLILYEKKKYNLTKNDFGLSRERTKDSIIPGLLIPIVILVIFNLGNLIMVGKLMVPKDSPSMYYNGLILFFMYLLIMGTCQELLFRGMAQSKIEAKMMQWQTENRIFKYDSIKRGTASVISGGFSLGLNLGASVIIVRMLLGTENTRYYIISGDYLGLVILGVVALTIIPSIINPYLYQRTKSILPGILMTTIFFGIALTSGALGAGVVFF